MNTHFIEASNNKQNWGKFMLARFEQHEWNRRSEVDQRFMLDGRGWTHQHLLVLDLQTGEGAIFLPGGSAHHDLEKHKVWVCPLFEPFLHWLWAQDTSDLSKLPNYVDLPDAPFLMAGHRRSGKGGES